LPRSDARQAVLFLCTGNYYRSRFAEILFNAEAVKWGLPWRAFSRGLAIERGFNNVGPLSCHTSERLARRGIACDEYLRLPLQAEEQDFARARLIIALKEAEHRPLVQKRFPAWNGRVEYWHVHDLDGAGPDEALACLEQEVHTLAARLAAVAPA
jgi:protein-tyrosine phosphatase